MKTYRITIEESTDADSKVWRKQTEIVVDSQYLINFDLAEWAREEIDKNASVTHFVNHEAHVRRAGYRGKQEIEFCEECAAVVRVVTP